MLDDFKETQKVSYKLLKTALMENNISHAYLIETNGYEKGLDFAISFAKALLCEEAKTKCEACKNCKQCQNIDNNNFLELEVILTDEMWIKKEKITDLQKTFSFKPIVGKRKVYIIDGAEKIKENLTNSLLKFIEEPEEGIVAILVTENKNNILPTIISRCQMLTLVNKNNENLNIYDEDLVSKSFKFVSYIEKNGLESILFSKILVHDNLQKREEYENFFDTILLIYKELLSYKLTNKIKAFTNFKQEIEEFSNLNEINQITKKIDIIMQLKKYIRSNVNTKLIIDKLIIMMKKVK